ncbi:hypothetical protein GQX74_013655 [Glossina fuscipes]|nr:hypothetical protein GQX74_013655 [Glossina fuscipes]
MSMHSMPQMGGVSNIAGSGVGPSNSMMQSGVSPLMQSSPQQSGQQMTGQMSQNPAVQQQSEKIDNISKVKSLFAPMKESLLNTFRGAAYTLQQNNSADSLKRDPLINATRFDKHLEEFYAYCDQIELHLKTAMQCMQQLSSAQYYLPGAVTALRTESYMQDNPAGPMPYPTYLNTVRVHIQSAKDIRDTLISASQNISQAD